MAGLTSKGMSPATSLLPLLPGAHHGDERSDRARGGHGPDENHLGAILHHSSDRFRWHNVRRPAPRPVGWAGCLGEGGRTTRRRDRRGSTRCAVPRPPPGKTTTGDEESSVPDYKLSAE